MERTLDFIEILHSKSSELIWKKLLDFFTIYFRIEVVGADNILKGRSIILPNHSGYAGFDAVLLLNELKKVQGKPARVLVHRAYFDWFREIKEISESFGFKKASITNGKKLLENEETLVIFPEAEDGNFKSTCERYHLQKFHTGALRLASQTNTQIVPCLIIGAEESHINLKKFDLNKFGIDLKVPLPLNVFPLPAKWKIIFFPPVSIAPGLGQKEVRHESEILRKMMQEKLDLELKNRKYIYFDVYDLKKEISRLTINTLDVLFNQKK